MDPLFSFHITEIANRKIVIENGKSNIEPMHYLKVQYHILWAAVIGVVN
jgi:hypothetical protein